MRLGDINEAVKKRSGSFGAGAKKRISRDWKSGDSGSTRSRQLSVLQDLIQTELDAALARNNEGLHWRDEDEWPEGDHDEAYDVQIKTTQMMAREIYQQTVDMLKKMGRLKTHFWMDIHGEHVKYTNDESEGVLRYTVAVESTLGFEMATVMADIRAHRREISGEAHDEADYDVDGRSISIGTEGFWGPAENLGTRPKLQHITFDVPVAYRAVGGMRG